MKTVLDFIESVIKSFVMLTISLFTLYCSFFFVTMPTTLIIVLMFLLID